MKLGLVATILLTAGIFNSCGTFLHSEKRLTSYPDIYYHGEENLSPYGAYLAGRVAHLRQDYDSAADYYITAINRGATQADVVGRAYLLLTAEGRIKEAADYAQQAQANGDNSNIIRLISMAEHMKNSRYEAADEALQQIKDEMYRKSILPLFEAWIYAAQNDPDTALQKLNVLKQDQTFDAIYYMHSGLIHDLAGNVEEAQSAFDKVAYNEDLELSFRSLQLISNFYTRIGQQDKAVSLVEKYHRKNPNVSMLAELYEDIKEADAQTLPPMIKSAQDGEAEALFNVGTLFRSVQLDIAQIFTSLALYLNPQNDVARVSMADLFEFNRRFAESIEQYDQIGPESPIYFMAQLKIATAYMANQQTHSAIKRLKKLETLYPKNFNVEFNLGEAYRMANQHDQAIKHYNKALRLMAQDDTENWTIYYALGVSYERNRQWPKAEDALQTAITKSNRHPLVLNYLGYSWLKHNQNSNEALYMIFDAYRQSPEDGHIIDSLGWALYRMGRYDEATAVLERASEYLPANAVVYDHLGDAYWQSGRQNEARFQWQHALSLKEDAEELNKDIIRRKIKHGAQKPATLNFNEALLVERLKSLDAEP